tara:strand:+ start:4179 stop:4493 length:315 start_codon:yes stop_codon:yes gene_type:complete
MKKFTLLAIFVVLGGCTAQNTPDFILKYTDNVAYQQKLINENCEARVHNRVVQVDGVVGMYDYTSNYDASFHSNCKYSTNEFLDTYQNPAQYGKDRKDVKPLTY